MGPGEAAANEYREQCEKGALMPSSQLLQVFANLTVRSDGVVEVNASQCIFTRTHFDVFLNVVAKMSETILRTTMDDGQSAAATRPLKVRIVLRDANIDNGAVLSLANAVAALVGLEDVLVVDAIDLADNVGISTVGGKRLKRLCNDYRPLCEVGLRGCPLNAALQRQVEEAAQANARGGQQQGAPGDAQCQAPSSAAHDGDATPPDRPATPLEQVSAVRADLAAATEEGKGNRTPQTEPRVSGTNDGLETPTASNLVASPPENAKPPSSGRPSRPSMADTLPGDAKPPCRNRSSVAPPTIDSTEMGSSARDGSSGSTLSETAHDASMRLHPIAPGFSGGDTCEDPTMTSRTLLPTEFTAVGVPEEQPTTPRLEEPMQDEAAIGIDPTKSSTAIGGSVAFSIRTSLPYLTRMVESVRYAPHSSASSPSARLHASLAPSTKAVLSLRGGRALSSSGVPHLDALLTATQKLVL